MSEERIKRADFDHVSDQGDLVFVCDRRHFAVTVDDALDHAILEAKQIREEEEGAPLPHASSALPVSSIQAAVRSGMETSKVARQFAVNEALVRRFAAPVETEKKYAVEQFLTLPAPHGSRGRTNEEVIDSVLDEAGLAMGAVNWQATRRGYEPWRIVASIPYEGRVLTANWTWNMRDNTVTSLNNLAGALLGESGHAGPTGAGDRSRAGAAGGRPTPVTAGPVATQEGSHPSPEGDGQTGANGSASRNEGIRQVAAPAPQADPARSKDPAGRPAREEGVQTGFTPAQSTTADAGLPAGREADGAGEAQEGRRSALTAWLYGPSPSKKADEGRPWPKGAGDGNPPSKVDADGMEPGERDVKGADRDMAGTTVLPAVRPEGNVQNGKTPEGPAAPGRTSGVQEGDGTGQGGRGQDGGKPGNRKHPGRSAVPSWDEILFGD